MYTEEDFERINLTDTMYLQEQQREEEELYWEWEEENENLPARISILLPILKSEVKNEYRF
jgi:hypothetical protein